MANPSAFSISSSRKGSAEMASFHFKIKSGKKGRAVGHAEYIAREGIHQKRGDLMFTGHGNMPSWAQESARAFWAPADLFERSNGAVYRESIVALPRGLSVDQLRVLVNDMVPGLVGSRPYQLAVHSPKSSIDGGKNPHLHLMYSDRVPDGIERSPETYFRRFNPQCPSNGGCRKLSGGRNRMELRDELIARRKFAAEVQNRHLAQYGRTDFVDHRTLKAQGVNRAPERHLGPAKIGRMSAVDVGRLKATRLGRIGPGRSGTDAVEASGVG